MSASPAAPGSEAPTAGHRPRSPAHATCQGSPKMFIECMTLTSRSPTEDTLGNNSLPPVVTSLCLFSVYFLIKVSYGFPFMMACSQPPSYFKFTPFGVIS